VPLPTSQVYHGGVTGILRKSKRAASLRELERTMADLSNQTRELRRGVAFDEPGVRDAIRTGFGVALAGLLFLVVADLWISTCTGSIAEAAGCTVSQRTMLTLGAPALLLAGGVWAMGQGFRVREHSARWAWHAAGWSLLALTVISAYLSLPSLPAW
jgi:hypothetical protein